MTDRMRILSLAAFVGIATTLLWQVVPEAAQAPAALAQRIVHTDPAAFRMSPAVHGGAGSMGFTALLNRGAVTPEFNFLHRGVIPPGAGIGHHFHNTVEEMFVILDGEAQFTIDGRTATVKGPAGVICKTGHAHAIYNASSTPVQWMNLNVSLNAGVYDNFDLGDTRAGAPLDPIPTFMVMRLDRDLIRPAGARGRGGAPAAAAPSPTAAMTRRALGPVCLLDDMGLRRSRAGASGRFDRRVEARCDRRGVLRARRQRYAYREGHRIGDRAGSHR